jgi:hypothetical protein
MNRHDLAVVYLFAAAILVAASYLAGGDPMTELHMAIRMVGAVFDEYSGGELARILRAVADRVSDFGVEGIDGGGLPLFDLHGNRAGLVWTRPAPAG